MNQAEHGWINIARNILDVTAAILIVGFVVTALSVDVPEAAVGPLQDSTLALPGEVYLQTSAISVNRTMKGDRDRSALLIRQRLHALPSSEIAQAFPMRIPPGCDPAFSPVADPAHAHIYKRCFA